MSLLLLHLTDSMTAGELVVGVGTALLAGFTFWLGLQARRSARAAQEGVEASEEPFVIATATDVLEDMILRPHERPGGADGYPPFAIHRAHNDDGTHFVRLKLWNIGSGPAIVHRVCLVRDRDFLDSLEQFQPLGAGHAADIEVASYAWPVSLAAATLTIDYTRASGLAYRTSQAVTIDGPIVVSVTYKRDRLSLTDLEAGRLSSAYRSRHPAA